MAENAEDIINKQQIVLENYFNLLGSFAFDKAKEYLDKEREIAVKNHSVAPFFSSALASFAALATAEKNFANLTFLLPKGFLRKDSTLKSSYENLLGEFQRLEEKHYITPVTTPTMSPTASCRTPSPPSAALLLSPSPVSGGSETSGSVASFASATSSVKGSSSNLQAYLGEDILENLASHLCGQLLTYAQARIRTIDLYEKMYAMGTTKNMKYDVLLNTVTDIVKTTSKLFHHPMLSTLKSSFSFECEILMKLLEAQAHMTYWRFLAALLCLHEAHSKLGAWVSSVPKEMKKSSASSSYKPPAPPLMYNWLRNFKGSLVSKFTLYFHEVLSKQTQPSEMKNSCLKASFDYFGKIVSFQKKTDAACIAIVLDTNGLDDYTGHGYAHPKRICEPPKGLDSFPPIFSYPPNCFTQEKHLLHWPCVVMIMNNKEQEMRAPESIVSFFDSRMNATYFMTKIEAKMTLVLIYESRKTERDSNIIRFLQMVGSQLRGYKVFSLLKPGSKPN